MRRIIALICIIPFLTASSQEQTMHSIFFIQQVHEDMPSNAEQMHWTVLIKEQVEPKMVEKWLKRKKDRPLDAGKNTENEVRYIMDIIEDKNISATMTITHYKQYGQAEVIVEITGTNWGEQIEEQYDALVTELQRTYFSRKARVFACLTVTHNATMYRNEFIENIKETLQLQNASELTDPLTDPKDQRIWYGYTPRITETLTIENENTNVQIVVNAKEDQQFTVIIGTPIIIHEY